MIAKLELESFGKFEKVSFETSPVTVFHGPNEAGKSTLFDALSLALCGPNGLKSGKRAARYGKGCAALARDKDGKVVEPVLDATEFLAFYAIHSASIEVPLSRNGVWMDRVRNSLFAGGINPEVLSNEIEKSLHSMNRKKEEAARTAALAAAGKRVEEVRGDLEAQARAKAAVAEAAGQAAGLEGEVASLSARRAELFARQERAAAAGRLREAVAWLAEVERLGALESRPGRTDETASLGALKEESRGAVEALQGCKAREGLLREQLTAIEARRRAAEEAVDGREPAARLARDLVAFLEPENVVVERTSRKPGAASWIAITLFPAAGAFAALLLSGLGIPAALGIFGAALALGILSFFLLRSTETLFDDSRPRLALERARSDWKRHMGPGSELPGADAGQALSWLRALEGEAFRFRQEADSALSAFRQAEASAAAFRRELDAAASSASEASSALSSWLAARQAATPDEYLASLRAEGEKAEASAALKDRLQAEAGRRHCGGRAELVASLRAEMEAIRKEWEGIDAEKATLSAADAQRLREVEAKLEESRGRLTALSSDARVQDALASKDEAALLDDLGEAETLLSELAGKKVEAELRRDAESAALEVFREMARKGTESFSALSRLVASYYSTGIGRPVDLSFASLNLEEAMVPDAGGQLRRPDQLSLGTRDCFVLACRLALAETVGGTGGILVFDEPFKNLDPARSAQALAMVGEYRKRRGSQIFFFTKDPSLVETLRSVFPSAEVSVTDLGASQTAGKMNQR